MSEFFEKHLSRWSWAFACALSISLAICLPLAGQTPDSSAAHAFWLRGEELKSTGDGAEAAQKFRQARAVFEKGRFWERAGQMVHREGVGLWFAGDLAGADSLIGAFAESPLSIECTPAVKARWHLFRGKVRFTLGEGNKAIQSLQIADELATEAQRTDLQAETSYWSGKAQHFLTEDFESAEKDYHTAIQLWEVDQDSVSLSMARMVLGELYREVGDHGRAVQLLEWVLAVRKELFGEAHSMTANAFIALGNAHYEQNHFERARVLFEHALDILTAENSETNFSIALLHNNLGALWDATGQPEKGLAHYREALAFYRSEYGSDHPDVLSILLSMGIAKQNLGDSTSAMDFYKEALAIGMMRRSGDVAFEASEVQLEMGNLCRAWGDWDGALVHIQSGMELITPGWVANDIFSHPKPDPGPYGYQLLSLFGAKAVSLEGKALAMEAIGKSGERYRAASIQAFGLGDALVDGMRRRFLGHASKGFLGEVAHGFLQDAVRIHLDAWRRDGKMEHLEKAFHYAEKGKFMVVWEALAERAAASTAGLPADLAEQEWEFRREISRLDGRLGEAADGYLELTEREVLAAQDSLNRLLASQDSLSKTLRKDYPDYARLYLGGPGNSVSSLREQVLDDRTCILHYFLGKNALHLFLLSPTQFTCIDLPAGDSLQTTLREFALLASSLKQDPGDGKLYHLGKKLHDWLVTPALSQWNGPPQGTTGRLVVVADGPLSALPFEALVQSDGQKERFLIEDFQIAYGYSGPLQCALFGGGKKRGNGKFLAYAWSGPYGKESEESAQRTSREGNYRNLPGSYQEVQALARHLDGDLFWGEKASKNHFLSHGGAYAALHFALHGEVSPADAMRSHLVFPPDSTGKTDRLYAYELFGLPMLAEMAVLSACETGAGEWVPGEGVHSLARAFAYNGVPAVVSTLWKVEDASAERLMDRFYEGLGQGLGKDEALREAKLSLIREGGRHGRLPFYWAPYVLSGDWRPLEAGQDQGPGQLPFYGLLALSIFLLSFILFKKLRQKA